MNSLYYIIGLSIIQIGLIFVIFNKLSNISYKIGHLSARVEELETWRTNVRGDFHEVSDYMNSMNTKVSIINNKVDNLLTLIDERTNKRSTDSNTPLFLNKK